LLNQNIENKVWKSTESIKHNFEKKGGGEENQLSKRAS
jgi:hypothetical protein